MTTYYVTNNQKVELVFTHADCTGGTIVATPKT